MGKSRESPLAHNYIKGLDEKLCFLQGVFYITGSDLFVPCLRKFDARNHFQWPSRPR